MWVFFSFISSAVFVCCFLGLDVKDVIFSNPSCTVTTLVADQGANTA